MTVTLKESAYGQLRRMLEVGKLQPGDRLAEIPLAREAKTSRTPLREAIRQLASEGLVEHVPGLGAYVRRPDRAEILDVFEAREALEGFAAAKAARCIGRSDLEQVKTLCDQMHDILRSCLDDGIWNAARRQALIEVDIAFHQVIIKAAGNERIHKLSDDYRLLLRMYGYNIRPGAEGTLAKSAWTWGQHLRIYRALEQGNADAARAAMAEHIQKACKKMLAACPWLAENNLLA